VYLSVPGHDKSHGQRSGATERETRINRDELEQITRSANNRELELSLNRILRLATALLATLAPIAILAPGTAHAEGDVLYMGCSAEYPSGQQYVLAGGCLVPGVAVSGSGTAGLYSCSGVVVAVSVTSSSCAAPNGWIRVSDVYPYIDAGPGQNGYINVPGVGAVYLPGGYTWYLPNPLLLNLDGIAISGTGTASSDWIAVSGTDSAYAPLVVSGKVLDPGPPFPGCVRGILNGFKGYWCPAPDGTQFFVPDPWDN
jgi:hypothetical protein